MQSVSQINNNINTHYSTYPSANQFEITNPARVLSIPIKTALQAASSKSSIPVLEGILFELTGEGLVLTGSDLEQWIVVRVEEVKLPLGLSNEPIKFVMPKKVAEAILRLPDGLAVFEFLPERVALKINYGFNLKNSQTHQLYRTDDFIRVPEVSGDPFPFPVDFKRVAFATMKNQMMNFEPIFSCVNINFVAGKVIATDKARMAVLDIDTNGLPDSLPPANVPEKIINHFSALDEPTITRDMKGVNGGGDGAYLIKIHSEKDNTTVIGRLIPGRFPPVQPIVERVENPLFVVEFSAREMTGTLNRVGLMISGNQMPKFVFKAESDRDGYITVSAQSESGMVAEDIYFELIDGVPENVNLECLFNARFIMDALKHAESEKVTWGLTGQYTPSVIRAAAGAAGAGTREGKKGDDWLCIIVPGRVAGE